MDNGWIKIHRSFLTWEWIDKPEMVSLFLFLLLSANTEKKTWRGMELERGQFVTTQANLSKRLNLSRKVLRTCLERLKETGEIDIVGANKFSVITICKYDDYQDKNLEKGQQRAKKTANKRPTKGQQKTPVKSTDDNGFSESEILKGPTNGQEKATKRATTKEYIYNIKEISTNVDIKKVDGGGKGACADACVRIEKIVTDFMDSHQSSLDAFCMKNKITRKEFGDTMEEVLTEWELTGWTPAPITKGRSDYESVHFLNTMRIKISEKKKKQRYEDNKTDRLQRRREFEPTVESRQSFNGTL